MRKTLLFALGMACMVGAQAQTNNQATGWTPPVLTPAQENYMVTIPYRDYKLGNETPSQYQINNGSNYSGGQRAINETVIGTTRYDLQTNASIQRRILNHSNGDLSAVWTFSAVNDWSTRGSGYNFFDGTAWGTAPIAEIETERTGWPNIGVVGSSTESIFAHNTASDVIRRSDRNTIGSGTWNQANLTPLDIQVWSRLAIAGPNNNTVHLIGLTLPSTITTGTPGVPFNGIDGALLYNRSLDGGQTWDIISLQLPNMDSTNWEGFGGDSYSIDARGNTVAIVVGVFGYGVQLWKSTDNGSTWTHTVIVEPAFPRFDEAVHFIAGNIDSSVYTSDENVHVLLDNNDDAHVFFGRQRITNDVIGDGALGFFPFQNGIDYWNENWGDREPLTIAGALDHNGNGALDIPDGTWLASYRFTGLASAPTAGIDANGDLYVVYHAVHEEHDNLAQKYHRVYAVKSTDNGCTWTTPLDLTDDPTHDFDECVYPSLARRVDSKLHLVYQRDFEPGIAVAGDEDPVVTNDILYLSADVSDLGNTPGVCAHGIQASGTSLCPGDTIMLEAYCGTSYAWSTGATTQTLQITTFGQYILSTTTACGVLQDTVDIVAPSQGPNVNITGTNNLELCPGDNLTLTANTNSTSATYLWSNGATAVSTTVNAVGTYTVSVTDCGGTSVQSVTVNTPGPPSTTISGPTFVCPGTPFTLTVNPVSGGSYVWFNGATGNSITLQDTTGLFQCNVSNCGGSTVVSIGVGTEPAPSPSVSVAGDLEFCEGDDVTLTAGGGQNYRWNGPNNFMSTNGSITLDQIAQSGDYFLTAFNGCGDSATTTTATSVTVNPLPAVPAISYSNGTYTSSVTSGNQWFFNGTLQAGEIQQTWTPSFPTSGGQVTVSVTDGNGCSSENSVTDVLELSNAATAFSVFPNPNNGDFTLQFTNAVNDLYTIEITNLVGQLIYSETVQLNGNNLRNLNLNGMDQGVYMLTVRTATSETTDRIMVR
ncbi:MAG: T9SS type A sorting domain-containing protein [Salibacteraceae bacterium]